MSIKDYEPILSTSLDQIGYTARWATYEDGNEVAEILDLSGDIVDSQEAWDIWEATDWVEGRALYVVLEALGAR